MVVVAQSNGHYDGTRRVLGLIEEDLKIVLQSKSLVVVKPNFVSTYSELSATPVEAVKALLDMISKYYDKEIIITESPAMGSFENGLRNYGYYGLMDEYNVEFIALDDYEGVDFYVWDRNLNRNVKVKVSKLILNSDCLISITRPKTHDTVIVTLTIKNIVMGAIQRGYKSLMHQGYKAINLSLAYLATFMMPSLGIIDGFIGMEGNGPISGSPVESRFAVTGLNPVEVDGITCSLMGFDPSDVGYLYYLNLLGYGSIKPNDMSIIGVKHWTRLIKRFRPHHGYRSQLKWRLRPEEWLRVKDILLKRGKKG